MSPFIRRAARGTLILAGISACSDGDAPSAPVPCTETVTMKVTLPNNIPRFDWTPRCGVSLLQVASGPSIQGFWSWEIEAESPTILPPITLNVAPNGVQSTGGVDLRSGLAYRVDLFVNTPGRPPSWLGSSGWTQP